MKRVKYTNTGVTPLKVERMNETSIVISDDSYLNIRIIRIRNSSKNQLPACHVIFLDRLYMIERNPAWIYAEISNMYLFWSLRCTNRRLCDKLFAKMSMTEKKEKNLMLWLYVSYCVLYRFKRMGIEYEEEK